MGCTMPRHDLGCHNSLLSVVSFVTFRLSPLTINRQRCIHRPVSDHGYGGSSRATKEHWVRRHRCLEPGILALQTRNRCSKMSLAQLLTLPRLLCATHPCGPYGLGTARRRSTHSKSAHALVQKTDPTISRQSWTCAPVRDHG